MRKNTFMTLLVFSSCFSSCLIDRHIPDLNEFEIGLLHSYRTLREESRLTIAPEEEPGQRLYLCLTFRNRETGSALSNREVHFYHADIAGEYRPSDPGDESTARLSGLAVTDKDGRIFLDTTLPGDYGSSVDNRHLHTTVSGASPAAYDIHFKQYTGVMGKSFFRRSEQHFLADLRKGDQDFLVAFLDIKCKFQN